MCCSSGEDNEFPKEKLSRESALELAKLLVKKDTSWEVTSSGIDTSKPTLHKYGNTSDESDLLQQVPVGGITPLFLATKSGCIDIVREILELYPQAVEHIDNDGRTILHVAIKYRQLEVFDLVLKMEVAMRWLVRRLDNDGNSIPHMAGKKRHYYIPEKLRGPALELQEELLWFEVQILVTLLSFVNQAISHTFCVWLRDSYFLYLNNLKLDISNIFMFEIFNLNYEINQFILIHIKKGVATNNGLYGSCTFFLSFFVDAYYALQLIQPCN